MSEAQLRPEISALASGTQHPCDLSVIAKESLDKLSAYPLPSMLRRYSHHRDLAIAHVIAEGSRKANNLFTMHRQDRTVSVLHHSLESLSIAHSLLPSELGEELADGFMIVRGDDPESRLTSTPRFQLLMHLRRYEKSSHGS